jgi:low affinity Fe/Cu permease
MRKLKHLFTKFAQRASTASGHSITFILAMLIVVIWAITGPIFDYSDTWQLVINTGTTIITFLMVFLIQNTQNRDTEAMQIKLDEIIYRMENAQNALLDLEELEEDDLNKIRETYRNEAKKARNARRKAPSPEEVAEDQERKAFADGFSPKDGDNT